MQAQNYKFSTTNEFTGAVETIIRTSDNAFIPFDPANTDAVEFAKWLKDGGIPEPATEGEVVTPEWIAETIAKLLANG